MRKKLSLALVAALLAAPLQAQTRVAIDAAPGAPAPSFGASAVPSINLAPALISGTPSAAASIGAPVLAAAPSALPAASLPAAALPTAAALVPADAPALALSKSAPVAAAAGPKSAPAAAAADAPDVEGRELFDQAAAAPSQPLSEIVREHSSRPLRSVFIQQEHEGSLLAPDSRDSSGDIFRYYRPIEMRPALTAAVDGGLSGLSKFVYSVRRALQFGGRSAPDAAWRVWPLKAKLDYLDRLEAAVAAEHGPRAVWDGKVSLILERKPEAPDFLTPHPHMEPAPDAYRGAVGAHYLQPEIVSAKEHPAASVAEALGRAKQIIAETGHAGVQFHVFVKAAPEALLAQMDSLDGALQLVNDVLFARAAAGSDLNIVHNSLMPWHRGRSERVRELLMKAESDAHVPAANDQDSEKHAFVGFRYWGMENGKAVVSLELRGASLPWKNPSNAAKGLEVVERPERDYTETRAYLTFLSLYAEALAAGKAPRVPVASAVVDERSAESAMRKQAQELGMPESAYDGLGALARRLTGAAKTPQGYLFPFAASPADAPELRAFEKEVVLLAARAKASEEAGHLDQMRHTRYLFWAAYQEWAKSFGARQDARLADMVRAVSR
jgi:hypothetical protein